MSAADVELFEQRLGFPLPLAYKDMLRCVNGFDRECIDVQGGEDLAPRHSGQSYKYPDDLEEVAWLMGEISEYRWAVDECLEAAGFRTDDLVGFVPIHGHRALAVFNDRKLSPVISIVGSDVIIYGSNLVEYLQHEFLDDED
ncbi:hypothetical protein J7E70_26265 [Variovorax paradoxus]|nr:SMI1/KNR4 family protein [Variovorax paradoxus]MBT2303952.1 hypothetical protein [Variovorax paradoxus]